MSALSLFYYHIMFEYTFPTSYTPSLMLTEYKKLISFTRTRVLEYYVSEICG